MADRARGDAYSYSSRRGAGVASDPGGRLRQEQRNELIRLYIGQLERLRGDNRGFAALLTQLQDGGSGGWIDHLKKELASSDDVSAQSLLRAFRTYLVEDARAGACGEKWMHRTDAVGKPLLPKGLEIFNEQLGKELAQGGLEPVTASEIASDAPDRGSPSGETYQQLHQFMADNNWPMTIASLTSPSELPHAMYCGESDTPIADVAEALRDSISSTIWTKVIVLVMAWQHWAQSKTN